MNHNHQPRRPRVIAATARLDNPRRPTRAQRIAQNRQARAWKRKTHKKGNPDART